MFIVPTDTKGILEYIWNNTKIRNPLKIARWGKLSIDKHIRYKNNNEQDEINPHLST